VPPVLTIHVIREGGDRYYVEDLVPGRAEGGPVAGEEPGRWTGDGAVALGLTGTVSAPTFGAVLGGRHPITGAALRTGGGARSVAGFDLTFAAPKSVSLLHALGPAEMAGAVGEGHRAAVTDAAGYLQRDAVGVRRSRGGQIPLLPAVGPVAGGFLHRTSRALDPHLHTHLVVANVAQGVDGRWSTVDGRRIFAHARAAGSVYHARLRREWRAGPARETSAASTRPCAACSPNVRPASTSIWRAGPVPALQAGGWPPSPPGPTRTSPSPSRP
jgi:conjugative relaxase-like TrwC/TraI family protein